MKSEFIVHPPRENNHSDFFQHIYKVEWRMFWNDANILLYLQRSVVYIVHTLKKYIFRTPCFSTEVNNISIQEKIKGKKESLIIIERAISAEWHGRPLFQERKEHTVNRKYRSPPFFFRILALKGERPHSYVE